MRNDHLASTSEILKTSLKRLDFDDFSHIPLIASMCLKRSASRIKEAQNDSMRCPELIERGQKDGDRIEEV